MRGQHGHAACLVTHYRRGMAPRAWRMSQAATGAWWLRESLGSEGILQIVPVIRTGGGIGSSCCCMLVRCHNAGYRKWSKERNQKRAEASKANKKRKAEEQAATGKGEGEAGPGAQGGAAGDAAEQQEAGEAAQQQGEAEEAEGAEEGVQQDAGADEEEGEAMAE